MITIVSPKKAKKFFEAKMSFTTGPLELNDMLKKHEKINVIDVRMPDDFAKGHIPGAANLPKEHWGSLSGLSKERLNVVYCYSEVCHLAASAARYFAEHGYPVMELEGGMETWKHYNLPVEH
jgi:rhodanese-related sulfurtransferase